MKKIWISLFAVALVMWAGSQANAQVTIEQDGPNLKVFGDDGNNTIIAIVIGTRAFVFDGFAKGGFVGTGVVDDELKIYGEGGNDTLIALALSPVRKVEIRGGDGTDRGFAFGNFDDVFGEDLEGGNVSSD